MTSYADFYRRSMDEPDDFWTEQAQLIDWQQPFTRVCNHDKPPFVHWTMYNIPAATTMLDEGVPAPLKADTALLKVRWTAEGERHALG